MRPDPTDLVGVECSCRTSGLVGALPSSSNIVVSVVSRDGGFACCRGLVGALSSARGATGADAPARPAGPRGLSCASSSARREPPAALDAAAAFAREGICTG